MRDRHWRKGKGLGTFRKTLPPHPSIFVLGTSLTACALPSTGGTSPPGSAGASLDYLAIPKDAGLLSDILPLMRQAVERGNCTVFVEAKVFGTVVVGEKREDVLRQRHWFNVHRQRSHDAFFLLFKKPAAFFGSWFVIDKRQQTEMSWDAYESNVGRFVAQDLKGVEEWLTLFEKATDRGVDVYLLDVPRSKTGTLYLPNGFEDTFSKFLQDVERETGVTYVKFPKELDYPEHYDDGAHFNVSGKRIYTEWFEKMVARKVGVTQAEDRKE